MKANSSPANSIQPHSRQFNQKTSQFNQIAAAELFVLGPV
jgi:hypothetical protein